MKKIIAVLMLTTFFSSVCNSKTLYQTNNSSIAQDERSYKGNILPGKIKDSLSASLIYDDEFIWRVLENDLTYQKMVDLFTYKTVLRETLQNKHIATQQDTLLTFTYETDTAVFYKSATSTHLLHLTIYSHRMIIDKDIQVGMRKQDFLKKFKLKSKLDTVLIRDIEGGNLFAFRFKKSRLVQINYQIEYFD